MAIKRSLIINSVDQGNNAKQRAVTDVNPNTDRVIIAELGEKLNALTENTLVEATSIGKTDLDIAGQTKRTPTLEITGLPTTDQEWWDRETRTHWRKFDINYDGDGKVYYPDYPEWPADTYNTNNATVLDVDYPESYEPNGEANDFHPFPEPCKCKVVYANNKWELWAHDISGDHSCLIVKSTEGDSCLAATATATLNIQF